MKYNIIVLLNIVHDRKLTFNNKEYMINYGINWNIIYFNYLIKQSTQKKIAFGAVHVDVGRLHSIF